MRTFVSSTRKKREPKMATRSASCLPSPAVPSLARKLTRVVIPSHGRVCVRTQNSHIFVAPAFRRALWNQAHARLKAALQEPKPSSHTDSKGRLLRRRLSDLKVGPPTQPNPF